MIVDVIGSNLEIGLIITVELLPNGGVDGTTETHDHLNAEDDDD